MSDHTEVFCGMVSEMVFTDGHVQAPMQRAFDSPMTSSCLCIFVYIINRQEMIELLKKGVLLSRDKRISRTILTTEGYQSFMRYRLFAVSNDEYPESDVICREMFGGTSVYPMDIYMGIENLPFKSTVDAALRIARYGATFTSYMEAVSRLKESFSYSLSDNQVREITDYIGDIILAEDIQQKEERLTSYHPKAMRIARRGRRPKDGVSVGRKGPFCVGNKGPFSVGFTGANHSCIEQQTPP